MSWDEISALGAEPRLATHQKGFNTMIKISKGFWHGSAQIAVGIYVAALSLMLTMFTLAHIWDAIRPMRPD